MCVAVFAAWPLAHLSAQSVDKAGHAAWAVQFRGGDERIARLKGSGHPANLVLTDSTVRLYFTSNNYELPDYEIPIRRITDLSGRSNRVGASLTNWATGDESMTIVYDGDTDAEAPVFKTDGNESAQLEATRWP